MSIKLVMLSYHLILCCTLLFLPSIFPSIRVFSNESALPIRWPKYWSFSFTICPSSEYSGLISFRIDWFALFTVQETLKVILQPCNLKASIPLQSAFFMVQFLHPYITTGKTRDLIIWWSFVSKVMFLLRNKLCLLWLSFQGASIFLVSCLESAVILEPKKRKSVTASTFSSSICHEVMGQAAINQLCVQSLQTCLSLVDPMDHSPPDCSVHVIFLARILECVAMLCSRGSS